MAKIEGAVAPDEAIERLETVRLHLRDDLVGQRRAGGGGAERAVAHATPGASGDLRQFGRGQPAQPVTVVLGGTGEGDVIDVHVEAHADRIGGDQEIDLLVLVERHLRVARARAEVGP